MQLGAAFGLSLLVLGDTTQGHELVVMLVVLLDPGPGRGRESGGVVGLFDVDEPGSLQEFALGSVGGDGDRPVAVGATPQLGTESGCRVDGEEGGASAGTKELAGGSQHGELGSQSTQHVGVHDSVEHLRAER